MKEELVLNEKMKDQMMALSLDQFFTRVTSFMKNSGAAEAKFTVAGDIYVCELQFKELKGQKKS